MRDTTVYLVTNPDGKQHIRTTSKNSATVAARGYAYAEVTINWKALRALHEEYLRQLEQDRAEAGAP